MAPPSDTAPPTPVAARHEEAHGDVARLVSSMQRRRPLLGLLFASRRHGARLQGVARDRFEAVGQQSGMRQDGQRRPWTAG